MLENVARRVFLIPFQLSRVATPVRNIMRMYSDLPVDFADVYLIHLADEHGINPDARPGLCALPLAEDATF